MEKPAVTDYPVHELIRGRWSPRAFAERTVDAETLRSVLEAARWAPSCFNDQPWHFIVARRQEPEEFSRLLGCLMPGNQVWADKAAVLMLSVARMHMAHNGKPYRHALHDVGLATAGLILQSEALGLHAHVMAGFDGKLARQTYEIPADHEPVTAIALGYPGGDPESLPDDLRQRELAPRTRKSQDEFVFTGTWGQAAKFS